MMKRVILVQDIEVDCHILQKLSRFPEVCFDYYSLQSFYPHLALTQRPDLIIFDINRCGTSWLWRLEQISSISDDWGVVRPYVIVLPATPSEELEKMIRGAKVDFYLPKTFDDASLDVAFARILS